MQDSGRTQEDELSFSDFKKQMSGLRSFVRGTAVLALAALRRYYLAAILLLAVAGFLGFREYRNSKSFEAKASFVYIELQKKTYGEMLDKLQDMIKAGSGNRVAEALGISPERARHIISLHADNIYGSKLSEDITEKNQLFYVTVTASEGSLYDSLHYAIERYLNNNVMVGEIVARRKKMLVQQIAYLKNDLAMLDSLKAAYTRNLNHASGTVFPAAGNADLVPLYEKGQKIVHDISDMESLLGDYRAVQTQDRFMVTEAPVGKPAVAIAAKYLALWVLACAALFFLLSIFRK